MKIFLSGIIIFSLLSYQFSELVIYAGFKINQDYIAKYLCIERDIEDSDCNGCCQLKKKVNEQSEQKQNSSPTPSNKLNINLIKQACNLIISPDIYGHKYKDRDTNKYKFLALFSVFHPPPIPA